MRTRLSDYQEMYGDLYNLEATPAESTAFRFAKHDKAQFPDIVTANENGSPYYTNSSHLPVGYTQDIFSALDVQDELQTLYTSGTVFHAFLGERLPNWKSAANLVKKIAENYKLPYYTLSPTYSICADHGYLNGEQKVCPHCGKPTETWSRITGYYRPVKNWNDGKLQEYNDRQVYHAESSKLTHTITRETAQASTEAPKATATVASQATDMGKMAMLFTTKTCPNCKMAKSILDGDHYSYKVVDAEIEVDLTKKFDVKQAPTLVVFEGNHVEVIQNVSNIKKFVKG